jgi:hypothetical protein
MEFLSLEALFADEVVNRFLGYQSERHLQAVKSCRRIKFNARRGAIVLKCPNPFLAQMLESLKPELETIAASIGTHVQIVVAGQGKCYW